MVHPKADIGKLSGTKIFRTKAGKIQEIKQENFKKALRILIIQIIIEKNRLKIFR